MGYIYEYSFDNVSIDDIKEIHLAEVMVDYLSHDNYEVYQEVQISRGGAVTDIIARRGNILHGIETKMNLSLQVMSQADRNCMQYHYSSIVYANKRIFGTSRQPFRNNSKNMAYKICRMLGIGIIQVQFYGFAGENKCKANVNEEMSPKLFRKNHGYIKRNIISILCEEHKTFCKAGSSTGGHLTPYKITMRRVRKIIEESPGCDLDVLLENLKQHHYSLSSVRSSLVGALREFESDWCLIKKEGKKNYFFVK